MTPEASGDGWGWGHSDLEICGLDHRPPLLRRLWKEDGSYEYAPGERARLKGRAVCNEA